MAKNLFKKIYSLSFFFKSGYLVTGFKCVTFSGLSSTYDGKYLCFKSHTLYLLGLEVSLLIGPDTTLHKIKRFLAKRAGYYIY